MRQELPDRENRAVSVLPLDAVRSALPAIRKVSSGDSESKLSPYLYPSGTHARGQCGRFLPGDLVHGFGDS